MKRKEKEKRKKIKINFVVDWALKESSLGQKGTSVHKRNEKGRSEGGGERHESQEDKGAN